MLFDVLIPPRDITSYGWGNVIGDWGLRCGAAQCGWAYEMYDDLKREMHELWDRTCKPSTSAHVEQVTSIAYLQACGKDSHLLLVVSSTRFAHAAPHLFV